MEIIRKIDTIEVKKCFAISQLIRWSKGKKSYLVPISRSDFIKQLSLTKDKVNKMTDKEIDKIVGYRFLRRLRMYNNYNWKLCKFNIDEVGVWRRAGGLPLDFTNKNLSDTASRVKIDMLDGSHKLKKRSKIAIKSILDTNIDILQTEKYLLPIAFLGGTGTRGRKRLKFKTKLDLDDGCMRSIALAVSGKEEIVGYVGFPPEINENISNN